jgi:hypothetical protein|tara:strand:+ start:453 stop:704 length:252 start_codon:yes stop_codon:yes gene_type:complete
MVILVDNKDVGHTFDFGAEAADIINNLTDLFIENYGEEFYNKATTIIIRHHQYYYLIKNIFGVPAIDLVTPQVLDTISHNLSL